MPTQGHRWVQYEEDAYRLPEGFKRVGYDADTQRYTFEDTRSTAKGLPRLYIGEPGMEYGGVMTPMGVNLDVQGDAVREAFSSTERGPRPRSSTLPAMKQHDGETFPPRTFADILPPELITTSSLSNGATPPSSSRFSASKISKPQTDSSSSSKQSQTASAQRLVDTVRRSALPKMHGVVSDLRRSVTSMRRNKNKPSSSRFNVGTKQGTSGSYTRFVDEGDDEENDGDEDEKTRGAASKSIAGSESITAMGTLDRLGSAHRPTMSTDGMPF